MKTTLLLLLSACGIMALVATGSSNENPSTTNDGHVLLNAGDMQWGAAPPSLPPGAQMAVVQGNPMKAGVYTLRLKLPSGYKFPPHTHPTTENVTIISGTMSFGMGGTFDESKGMAIKAGGFASMPAHVQHFAWANEASVIQVHGQGPFQIKYVNPSDDPRHGQK